jgi:mannose-6-phosphate isomerase
MDELPLLQFKPILREYLWGGRRLAELGKPLGEGVHYAESWEVVDHGADQSVVADGPLRGATLNDLAKEHGRALFGRHYPQRQFPLLLKYLDCNLTLSVQVHPNDEQGAKLDPPDLGKTEAWVVLVAAPGSRIYAGLKPGVDRAALERETTSGRCEACLHHFEPRPGDCLLIEAGTVHALGAGLLVAEIQQASDTTYRLYDWNRVGPDGQPRTLHVQQALDTIDFSRGPVSPVVPQRTERDCVERLVQCEKFALDRWRLDSPQQLINDNRFRILTVVEGGVVLQSGNMRRELRRGDTVLVPACCGELEMEPWESLGDASVLDMHLP